MESDASPETLLGCLRRYWGHSAFRPLQLEAIQAILSKRDTFVLMSTGSGKSICYQLPAVLTRQERAPSADCGGKRGSAESPSSAIIYSWPPPAGADASHNHHNQQQQHSSPPPLPSSHLKRPVVVVLSPLISLIDDQVLSMLRSGIQACAIVSATPAVVEAAALRGNYAVIFTTPEKLEYWDHGLRRLHEGPGILMFAIDESHCVSEWGADFRPEYARLGRLRDAYPNVPIMALTATATPQVQQEIKEKLRLRYPFEAKTSFNRPNLHYAVHLRGSNAVLDLGPPLKAAAGSPVIVYVLTRRSADEVAEAVRRVVGPGRGAAYHAGMPAEARKDVHERFLRDELQVVVATVAFGMGIDKPDVRLVVHYGMPKTVESYYQQTGRAGRDGLPARCLLLFSRQDKITLTNIMSRSTNGGEMSPEQMRRNQQLLAGMEKYATSPLCRRMTLLNYFGEPHAPAACAASSGCDVCDRRAAVATAGGESAGVRVRPTAAVWAELSERARLVLQAMRDSGGRRGITTPVALLLGGNNKKTVAIPGAASRPSFGKGKGVPESFWKALFYHLHEREGLLASVNASWTDGNGHSQDRTVYELSPDGARFLQDHSALLPEGCAPSEELRREMDALEQRAQLQLKTAAARREAAAVARAAAVVGADASYAASAGSGDAIGGVAGDYAWSAATSLGKTGETKLTADQAKVYDVLFTLRAEIAGRLGDRAYNVVPGQALLELAARCPADLDALRSVGGLGDKRIADYGREIVAAIGRVCAEHGLPTNLLGPPGGTGDGGGAGGSSSGGDGCCRVAASDGGASAFDKAGWLSTRRPGGGGGNSGGATGGGGCGGDGTKPLNETQLDSYVGFVAGKDVHEISEAKSASQAVKIKACTAQTVQGHLAKCLEADRPLIWDRRRLGIVLDVEATVADTIATLQARRGFDPLDPQAPNKSVREALPASLDGVYGVISLVLARMRYESRHAPLREVSGGGGNGGAAGGSAGGGSGNGGGDSGNGSIARFFGGSQGRAAALQSPVGGTAPKRKLPDNFEKAAPVNKPFGHQGPPKAAGGGFNIPSYVPQALPKPPASSVPSYLSQRSSEGAAAGGGTAPVALPRATSPYGATSKAGLTCAVPLARTPTPPLPHDSLVAEPTSAAAAGMVTSTAAAAAAAADAAALFAFIGECGGTASVSDLMGKWAPAAALPAGALKAMLNSLQEEAAVYFKPTDGCYHSL